MSATRELAPYHREVPSGLGHCNFQQSPRSAEKLTLAKD
jgi:hypothetical protein